METLFESITRPGRTLMHEHLTIDLSAKKNQDANLNDDTAMKEDLSELKKSGIDTIVDVTNRCMGRDIERMSALSRGSGINVVAATGYYKSPYLPYELSGMSTSDVAKVMLGEIKNGIGKSDIKAGIIGEIGTSTVITEDERKVFKAACYAQKETGVPIYTHTTLGRLAVEQLDLLKSNGADLSKVVIGHVDLKPDMDYYKRILDYGCYLGFDTIGKVKYQPDEKRAENILRLKDLGYGDRIVLSLDITRKSHLKKYGGYGHVYLFDTFLPMLAKYGLTQQDINNMLIDNPAHVFSITTK